MPWTQVDDATAREEALVTSFTVSGFTCQENDVLICIVAATDGGGASTTVETNSVAWTAIDITYVSCSAWWRIADGTETDADIGKSAGDDVYAWVSVLRDSAGGVPTFDRHWSSSGSGTGNGNAGMPASPADLGLYVVAAMGIQSPIGGVPVPALSMASRDQSYLQMADMTDVTDDRALGLFIRAISASDTTDLALAVSGTTTGWTVLYFQAVFIVTYSNPDTHNAPIRVKLHKVRVKELPYVITTEQVK
jgi:hypothetical protein